MTLAYIWLASLAYVAFEVLVAPFGYQDEHGFWLGRDDDQ